MQPLSGEGNSRRGAAKKVRSSVTAITAVRALCHPRARQWRSHSLLSVTVKSEFFRVTREQGPGSPRGCCGTCCDPTWPGVASSWPSPTALAVSARCGTLAGSLGPTTTFECRLAAGTLCHLPAHVCFAFSRLSPEPQRRGTRSRVSPCVVRPGEAVLPALCLGASVLTWLFWSRWGSPNSGSSSA